MTARRLVFAVVTLLCGLAGTLGVGAGSSMAAPLFGGVVGGEAGQISRAFGMAVDNDPSSTSYGDVYVGDTFNERVDKFEDSGQFLFAWGWGVLNGAQEAQTCTTVCHEGLAGVGAGQFTSQSVSGVAVDDDPLSASEGDVYAVDFGNARVEKFDATGKFLLMFGGHVNETTGGNVCVAGEKCTRGTVGSSNGEFTGVFERSYIAVGPGGDVYVGDVARVEVFEPSGAWRENISLAGLSSTGRVTALAVDSSGDIFVKDEGVPGVREFEPNGVEESTQLDEGSESVEAITSDNSGDVFVSDTAGGPHFFEYDASGKGVASFSFKTPSSIKAGMAFDDALDKLLVYSNSEGEEGVWAFTFPASGPVIEPGSESAVPGERGTATLEATIDPEGAETTYRFEYVDTADFLASGYADAQSTAAVSIGSGLNEQPVSVGLTKLVPGETYHYRVVATNTKGTASGPDQTVTTIPPALVEGPWATNAASTSITLSARINPLGSNTSYRLEYGTDTSYGHTLSGNVGEGTSAVSIGYHLQELQAGTTYHYRIVASNEVGTFESSDRTFTTQIAGGQEFSLPDGRTWEQASPIDKGGTLIEPAILGGVGPDDIQAASDGHGVTYRVSEPIGEDITGYEGFAQLMSERTSEGWRSHDIDAKQELPKEGIAGAAALFYAIPAFHLFSPDLSVGLVEPGEEAGSIPLSPEATERTLYLRNTANATYLPLETKANVLTGEKFGAGKGQTSFVAATPDLSHVAFASCEGLTPEVKREPPACKKWLYEWSGGQLKLVTILPDGEPTEGAIGSEDQEESGMSATAISSDGRWIAWHTGRFRLGNNHLYLRDMVAGKTIQIGGSDTRFETMSSDGSKVFFVQPEGVNVQEHGEKGELYVYERDKGAQVDLTANHGANESAGVQEAVIGASEDGSYLYFVATGVLASGAISGQDNLYLEHDTGSGWTTTLVATLSPEDAKSWHGIEGSGAQEGLVETELFEITSRVSPDGRYLSFMSDKSLTGYDNIDAVSGQPDEEVYLYDAATGRLVCASCNPTGARPVGVYDSKEGEGNSGLLVDTAGAWTANHSAKNHWLAANTLPWENILGDASYQPRFLSDGGRLFFDSPDALVSQDTNGLEDVYEYEQQGVGSCSNANSTFSVHSDGCVSLISSGQSSSESAFMDASETGDDVFFITTARLVAADRDTAFDVYDAHMCSESVPCHSEPVSPPACTSGDSCKAAPSPQPEIFGPTPSETFNGTGNVQAAASKAAVKPKALTRAQKLLRALSECHKQSKHKRAQCERQARKRYGAKTPKIKSTKKARRR